jgi:hypothetical protein
MKAESEEPISVRWLAEHIEEGTIMFRIGTAKEDEVIAEWSGIGRLFARRDGSTSRFEPDPSADPEDVAKVRRGSAAMLLRHLKGKLALHGAAVVIGNGDGDESSSGAVVITGLSGQGKSTLAAFLCARSSAALLSDDLTALDDPPSLPTVAPAWIVSPLETEHWLDADARRFISQRVDDDDDDAERDKLPIPAPRVADRSHRLAAIVEVIFKDELQEPHLIKLVGIDAVRLLVSQMVRFIIDEPTRHKSELDLVARLVDEVPIYRLERPRRMDLLHATADMLIATLGRGGAIVSP